MENKTSYAPKQWGNSIYLLIEDMQKEYEIPIPGHLKSVISTRYIYDSSDIEELLEEAGGFEDVEDMQTQIVKGLINNDKYNTYLTDDHLDNLIHSNIVEIRLPVGDPKDPFSPGRYLHLNWSREVIKAATEVSGDDDFFDYYPNFVYMYIAYSNLMGFDTKETLTKLKKVAYALHEAELVDEWDFLKNID
jgi:hypothetical protein